ncbi:hypothetical protein LUZ63_009458 [Rhynchospora breviuscula]|uniref:Reverse transcriptase Ty1/copia-type domain-containing protein n=1 Tax=Rhynchospora breviuscula TaxID=2022672 RepID=A0A9Q0HP57_9POAL|nr:hypothetical protein LUZ63_009458 [Rhynchospora breviuscula]
MTHASIPNVYWDEIFSSTIYLINRLPSHNHTIPYKTLFSKDPDFTFLRVIGCLCFPYTRPYNSHKLEPRAIPCVFIGYAKSQKGYRCLHIPTNKVYVSRHVQFDETTFPFQKLMLSDSTPSTSAPLPPTVPLIISNHHDSAASTQPIPMPIHTTQPISTPSTQIIPAAATLSPVQHTSSTSISDPSQHTSAATFHSNSTSLPTASDPAPTSDSQPPPNIHPNPSLSTNTHTTPALSVHPMTTRSRDNTRKPRHFPDCVALITTLEQEPTTFVQANSKIEWRQAMAHEIEALATNNTWTLVPPPIDRPVIGCKWVFKIKRKSDGTIDRYKARLVAKGFNPQEGVDYFDTFSPAVRPTTIRVILSIATSQHWSIRQLDVNNAFFHGDLTERVYMSQPPGFHDKMCPNHVCLLSKSLYGLKQSPRAWFYKLSTTLVTLGFHESHYDPSLFIAHKDGHTTLILIYVDDILVTGSNNLHISSLIEHLNTHFSLKDLGQVHYFLGMEVSAAPNGLHLSQAKYILDILNRAKMTHAKHSPTPMVPTDSFTTDDATSFHDPLLYRSIVGALQYATLTRPDISFAVNRVSQFMQNPSINHWTAVKRILRYLSGTIHHGLRFTYGHPFTLHAYSDSDWAGCAIDRRSTTGFCIYLGGNLVSWSAKKQPTVSRSSTEAEYRSLALTSAELLWLRYLLTELQITMPDIPTLWCDNIGATFLASNPSFHARTKHIEIDYHFVRERIASKELRVRFISSKDQLADLFTKPLPLAQFLNLKSKLTVDKASPLANTNTTTTANSSGNPIDPSSSSPSQFLESSVPINVSTPIKLTSSNFLTWQAQMLPLLNAYNLFKYLSSPPPPPTRQNTDGQVEFNQDYLSWSRQDQLLLSWLRASLSEPIQAQVVSCSTSANLWTMLQQQFATNSRARLIDLKRQFQSAHKGGSSCTDFLRQVRTIADELTYIGAPPSTDDLVLTILNGLGPEFNPFVAALTATNRNEALSFSDLQGMLLSHEALINSQMAASSSSTPSAFFTQPASGSSRPFNPNLPPPYSNHRTTGVANRGRGGPSQHTQST